MSILSLNLSTPLAFKTPSIPSGSLGNGSCILVASGPLVCGGRSVLLSVTKTRPWDLTASTRAGTMSCS